MPIFELPTSPEAGEVIAVGDGHVDHVTAALKRLPQQFKNKTNIEKLLKVCTRPAQELETVFWDIILARTVETATGAALEMIGKLVGQARNGLTDEDYRRYIVARITANKSKGLLETLIRICRLIVNDDGAHFQCERQNYATLVIRVLEIALTDAIAEILISFLHSAASAGVRIIVEYSSDEPELWLDMDDDVDTLDEQNMISAID